MCSTQSLNDLSLSVLHGTPLGVSNPDDGAAVLDTLHTFVFRATFFISGSLRSFAARGTRFSIADQADICQIVLKVRIHQILAMEAFSRRSHPET
jgi:hypothetical protein